MHLQKSKQQASYRCFSMLKWFWKANNSIIELYQQTSNVQCMYLALKNLKVTSKIGQ